ncbi:MAG: DUF6998 domain-containing protein [Sphingomonas sp.]
MVADLIMARDAVRAHYQASLRNLRGRVELSFTLDGNLVGDLGEAIAAEMFGIELIETKATEGFDGFAPDGLTKVQIKATGTKRGPVFRDTLAKADHLLFFCLDFQKGTGSVIYNGPEAHVRTKLGAEFQGQRMVSRSHIEAIGEAVPHELRLPRVDIAQA